MHGTWSRSSKHKIQKYLLFYNSEDWSYKRTVQTCYFCICVIAVIGAVFVVGDVGDDGYVRCLLMI